MVIKRVIGIILIAIAIIGLYVGQICLYVFGGDIKPWLASILGLIPFFGTATIYGFVTLITWLLME